MLFHSQYGAGKAGSCHGAKSGDLPGVVQSLSEAQATSNWLYGKENEMKSKNRRRWGILAALTACVMLFCVSGTGCGSQSPGGGSAGGDSQAASGDRAILVVSFGTSYNESRDLTIGAIEEAIAEAFPEYDVRRAFTSQIIIDKLKERDGLEIDNVEEALDRAAEDGIRTLVVQPTHLMNGYEYTDLAEELQSRQDQFDQVVLGEPLLTSDGDFKAVADIIASETASYDDGSTGIVFMGHGTEADSNAVYARLQDTLDAAGRENCYIGTVEAEPDLDDVREALSQKHYQRVILKPLMVVAGDHANNDMAGDEEDSWKSILTKDGYQVECLLEGMGQSGAIRQIYVQHVQDAIDTLA